MEPVAIVDVISDKFLHDRELEFSELVQAQRHHQSFSKVFASSCWLQLYGLKFSPCINNYAAVSDPNQLLLNKHPFFLPASILILGKQLV